MLRTVILFTILAAVCSIPCSADGTSVLGKWNVKSVDVGGRETTCTLVVQEKDGQLTGSMILPEVTIELLDLKLDGDKFTFKFMNGEHGYLFDTKINGDKIEGTFQGPEASGTVKGTRQWEYRTRE